MTQPDAAVRRALEDVVAPLIAADGGELYLVGLQGNSLSLHLTGRFSACPGNTLVLRHFVEPALRAARPGLEVKLTSGRLIPEGAERLV
jgi:Fe-S cluster biogenesis protein NfuA